MDPFVELILKRDAVSPSQSDASNAGIWNALTRLWKPKSAATAKFYGPATILKVDRRVIDSPLVYVCKGTLQDIPDASLIESGLPVSSSGKFAEQLPYWPSYRAASPAQRSLYLDWLFGGRCDPNVELGYVFIYFYGLERRSLVDRADHSAIASEILRLLPLYGYSRSFRRYASSLLWTTIWLSLGAESVPPSVIRDALSTTDWSEETLNTCLACFAQYRRPLPNKLVYRVAQQDVRSPRSVLLKRHPDLHKEAFLKRLEVQFPGGFQARAGKRDRRLEYFPASATLGRIYDVGGPLAGERIPNVLGTPSQFSPLVSVWVQTIEDLKQYDRAHKKAAAGECTGDMYEALPEHLRSGDHPHFEKWCQLIDRSVTDDGWTISAVCEFAKIEDLPERKKLTKAQSIDLATTAAHMGFAFEPDPRITGKNYEWNQLVSVFPATEELSQDVASYHAAAVLLELGVGIAAADGQIDDIELGRLSSHLEAQFDLSSQDSARLEHLRYLFTKQPPREFSAAKTLQKTLPLKQRKLIGEFLVGIAAADEQIAPEEVKALGKAYRALGLSSADLDELLRSVTVEPSKPESQESSPSVFSLDLNRINAIMQETLQVTQFLRDAMLADAEGDEIATAPNDREKAPTPALVVEKPKPFSPAPATLAKTAAPSVEGNDRFARLAVRLQPLLKAALAQDRWTRKALDEISRSHRLMLGAGIEQINEWSYEEFGDAIFVELDEEIEVQSRLLE